MKLVLILVVVIVLYAFIWNLPVFKKRRFMRQKEYKVKYRMIEDYIGYWDVNNMNRLCIKKLLRKLDKLPHKNKEMTQLLWQKWAEKFCTLIVLLLFISLTGFSQRWQDSNRGLYPQSIQSTVNVRNTAVGFRYGYLFQKHPAGWNRKSQK